MDYLPMLLGDASANSSLPLEGLIAAGLIVAAGLGGLAVGYFLGHRSGRLSGELETLKSMRRPKVHRSRSSSSSSDDED